VFFDEIQNVDKFELVINSLRAKGNVSIFITGSNAHLLSGELATHLSGRFVQFLITPFTFGEALQISGETDKKKAFAQFMKWGGLPGHFAFGNETDKQKYLEDVYSSIVLRDVVMRSGIRDLNLLDNIVQFLVENTGKIFSANTVSKYLKSQSRNISAEALYNYIGNLTNSLLFTKVNRFDIKGKNIFATLEKYYIADLGLLRIKRGFINEDLGARFETVIANELLARGYKINVGVKRDAEIDFVAEKNGEIEFIQAAYTINSDETLKREIGAFDGIAEKKTLITADDYDYSAKGIKSVNALTWLLEK
jgi:predicted AAA+ superfamily ATPase